MYLITRGVITECENLTYLNITFDNSKSFLSKYDDGETLN